MLLCKTLTKKEKELIFHVISCAIYSSLCHHNRNHYLIVVFTLVCRLSLTMWTKWSVARILSAPFRTSTAIFLYTWWICWRSWAITLQSTVNIRCWISLLGLITMDITLLNSRKRPLKVRLPFFLSPGLSHRMGSEQKVCVRENECISSPSAERRSTWLLFLSLDKLQVSVITLNLNTQFRTTFNIILCITFHFCWRFLLGCNTWFFQLIHQSDSSGASGSSATKTLTKASSSLLSASAENVADGALVTAQTRSGVSVDLFPGAQSHLVKPVSLSDLTNNKGNKK